MISIKLKDGRIKEFADNTSYLEISKAFGMGKEVLAAKINNEIRTLTVKPKTDTTVNFIDLNDLDGNRIYKSGLEFIFEVALKMSFPKYDISYEHSVPKGFLGEIIGNEILTESDIKKIKAKMAEIILDDIPFKKMSVGKRDAMDYYRKIGYNEKADNIQNISDKVVTIYNLLGYYNYFYSDMPYSTGSITNYDIIYLGNNRLVFVIPTIYSNNSLPEYINNEKIINSYLNCKNWLDIQNINYINALNKLIGECNINSFIKSCELVFNMNIEKVVNDIITNKEIKFVLLAGPSSSGKTTTTKRLSEYFKTHGFNPIVISTDDFFLEREQTPKDQFGNYDFECLEAIDLNLFNDTLTKLLNKEKVKLPTFNFTTGKKEYSDHLVELDNNSIILIEGLHSLNDDLLPSIDKKYKYKIYLSPFLSLNIDRHNYVSTIDLRLIRRIVRDNRTRGYKVISTIDKWQLVRNGEEKYIFPYIGLADKVINTAFPYEIGVLKVYVEPLLRSISVESEYYEEARRLLNFLKAFYPIPSEYVNKDSVLREFIGGNND